MNRITPILISLLFCSLMGHGQSFEPIDSIDWSIAGDGARSGVTPGFGYTWTAATPAADPDGAGIFAVQGGTFRIEDAEGTEGCDCDFEVSTNCGKNDNTIFIPAAVVMGYCKIRVSMTVTTSGNLDCGGTSDQLIPGTCPSDIDATWAGTDAMSIKVSGSALVDTDGHDICGEQGIGFVELTVDVSPVDAISLFITGGTQNSDEFYAISNIVIEGVRRDINDLNLTLTTQPRINNSNIICENNGTPLKFQVAASANNATFQWTGPNAWISSDASPEILNYDPTWSGTYRVTVTDRFSCPIMDEIDVTILAWDDANCRPQALFSNLFPTQCSDFTLPSMDDVGVPGTWAPSNDLSFFADSTLTFTFTPSEPAIGEYSQEMKVFDISESNRPAIQPTDRDRTIFCTAASDQVDLIELFNMNLDYTITVTGDKALFDKITTGQSINSVEQEYRTFSFLGVDPGPYEFFVEAVANCQTAEPILIPLSITVVDQNPVILNASLCSGDYIDTLGFRILGDTIIMTGGACDTVVRATISKLLHGVRPASSPHPTGSQISNCGNVFYFYGDEFQGSSQGVFVSATRDEAPPRGPDFDTIFYTSYNGPFTLPYPASNGCDSIITLDLVVPDSIITPIDTFICAGSELVLNADRLTTAGIYDVIYFAANGCDSIVRVNLEVIQPEVTDVDIVLCPGETILVFNNSFGNSSDREITETEFFTLVGTSSRGCDSTINLTLTQVSVGPPTLIEAICFGENVQVGNSIYTESGFYADTLSSSFGCDSIVRLDLDVRPQYINDLALTICTDGSITVGDSVITEVGFYAITISSVDGCDSLLNVTLSIGDAFITPLNVRICSGDEFIVGNSTYNSSGSYSDTIQSFAGCDSIINLELFVLEVQRTQLDTTICAGETLELDGNMFSTSIMDSVTILSSEGCDSIIIDFNLTVLNEINTVTNHNICPGESIRVGTSTYDMAGTYMDTIIASTGCDSIIRSIVSARDSIIVTLNQQICNGGSFTVGSSNYSAAGDYQDILLSNTGCDSIVMLSLEVVDQIETNIVVTICIGESYGFDGQDLTASGQYLDTLSSNLGCDSIVTLDLTVAPELAIIIENIIGSCEGVANGAFIIRDISGATPPFAVSGLPDISTIDMLPFTVTGLNPQTYSIDIADANGCTATIDVVITEDRNSAVTINATTIDPTGLYELSLEVNGTIGSIAWDNIPGLSCYECIDPMADILERTTFRVVVTDVDGCISMAEITLDVNGIGNIYVPNIFNPESRIGNHRFFIQGEDDSEAIYDLQIYDRWGSLIFGTIGATLSDPDFGWDGTMGGRRLNADVYIYSGRVYDVNGSVQLINGDLTMLK